MWTPLTDYSHRFGLSLSTLRRRIKTNTLKHKLENGKYYIWADMVAERAQLPAPDDLSTTPIVVNALLEEKEKRILLLEQHIRVLHEEIEALQSLLKMFET